MFGQMLPRYVWAAGMGRHDWGNLPGAACLGAALSCQLWLLFVQGTAQGAEQGARQRAGHSAGQGAGLGAGHGKA